MKTGRIFRRPAENRPAARVRLVLCAEHALHDDLIGAPVPDAEDRGAEEDPRPREVGIVHRLDHVEEIRRQRRAQARHPSGFGEPEHRQQHRAADQDNGLQQLGIDDRRQAAEDRVDAGRDHHDHRRREEVPSRDLAEHEAARVQGHRDLRKDVRQDRNRRQVPAAGRPVASLQEFGHRDDAAAQVERNEHPREGQHHEDSQPLEVADGETGARAGTRQADEVLARDVRREQRRPDGDPTHAAVREEVALARLGLPEVVSGHAEHNEEIGGDDDEIQRAQSFLLGGVIIYGSGGR